MTLVPAYRFAPPPLHYDIRDQTELRRALELASAAVSAGISDLAPPVGSDMTLMNFRIVAHDAHSVTFGWDEDLLIFSVVDFETTVEGDVATPPWPSESAPPIPTQVLVNGVSQIIVPVPAKGVTYAQIEARDARGQSGPPQRVLVAATSNLPIIYGIQEFIAVTGLFGALSAILEDPEQLGGTLKVWLNHDAPDDADFNAAPDGVATIDASPYTANASTNFIKTGGGSANLLRGIRINAGQGKHVAFEFVNTKGVSSGLVTYSMKSSGAIIDADGHLLPGPLADSMAFALTLERPFVAPVLPFDNTDGNWVYTLNNHKLYHWVSGAWVKAATVDGGDLIANSIIAGSIAAGAITTSAIAAGAITAALISVSALSAINTDLGIIVAGELTSVSGALTVNLNATGTAPVISATHFSILADGDATFDGILASSILTATVISVRSIAMGTGGLTAVSGITWNNITTGWAASIDFDSSGHLNVSADVLLSLSSTGGVSIHSSSGNVSVTTSSGSATLTGTTTTTLGGGTGTTQITGNGVSIGGNPMTLVSLGTISIAATTTLTLSATTNATLSASGTLGLSAVGPVTLGSNDTLSLSSVNGTTIGNFQMGGKVVSIGVANSGGTGFKALVVPN